MAPAPEPPAGPDAQADPQTDPPAVVAARRLLAALVRLGLRHVVVAPGSRSAPLALAAAEAATADDLTLHVRIDERDAGFLALGLARGTAALGEAAPVAVVTTSGTAVANLHPAVLEAHHAGVALLALTADRPHELRGTGANQTTEQGGIFAGATRLVVDVPAPDGRPGELDDLDQVAARAVAAALGTRDGRPGPVQLDLAYREPLVPDPAPLVSDPASLVPDPARGPGEPAVSASARPPRVVGPTTLTTLPPDVPARVPRTVVVAGDGAGPVARAVAEAQGWPLLAEPTSGATGGPLLVPAHRLVVPALAGEVARVVAFGHVTLSRPVQRLLAAVPELVVVAPGGLPWPDGVRHADVVLPGVPAVWCEAAETLPDDAAWVARWARAGEAARGVVEADLEAGVGEAEGPGGVSDGLDGVRVAATVLRAAGPDGVLVVGASNPVRDLDLVAGWAGDPPAATLANRGLAGIDGTVAFATGVALATGRRTVALVGDLTFLHDVGGLLQVPGEPAPDLTVVVANDGGGSIFATLEPGGLPAATFERVFATPHTVDLGALCRAYGVGHVRAVPGDELRDALAAPVGETGGGGVRVVEVQVDRSERRSGAAASVRAATQAVRAVLG